MPSAMQNNPELSKSIMGLFDDINSPEKPKKKSIDDDFIFSSKNLEKDMEFNSNSSGENGSALLHLGSDDEGEEEEENKEALKKLLEKMRNKKSRLEDDDEDTFFSGRLSFSEEDELPLPPPKV